jgi:hypothetical protein
MQLHFTVATGKLHMRVSTISPPQERETCYNLAAQADSLGEGFAVRNV